MSRTIIEEVWCVVATPYRTVATLSKSGKKGRRVSGEKGLGRLAASRLGEQLELITKCDDEPCWQLNVSWAEIAAANDLNACEIKFQKCHQNTLKNKTGTLVKVPLLKAGWGEEKVGELKDQLSRLISPFSQLDDFEIRLALPGENEAEPVELKPAEFLSKPPYLFKGTVGKFGALTGTYDYLPLNGKGRTLEVKKQLQNEYNEEGGGGGSKKEIECGPFDFEIRVWDMDKDAVTFQEISQRFDLKLTLLRKNIKSYQGLSLYRDGILVLPKSESAKDWLGLDLRRVSRIGNRISTSQIVGYVAITAKNNWQIEDTSDRERLVDNQASRGFSGAWQEF